MSRASKPTRRDDAQPLGDLAETLGRLLRNTVFRLSLVGALLFGVSLLVAQGIVYYQIVSAEQNRIEDGLRTELTDLISLFQTAGDASVNKAIADGVVSVQTVIDANGNPVVVPSSEEDKRRAQVVQDRASRGSVSRVVTLRDVSPDIYSMFVFKGAAVGKLITQDIQTNGIASRDLADYAGRGLIREQAVASVTNPETGEVEERRIVAIGQNILEDGERVGVLLVGRDVENIARTG